MKKIIFLKTIILFSSLLAFGGKGKVPDVAYPEYKTEEAKIVYEERYLEAQAEFNAIQKSSVVLDDKVLIRSGLVKLDTLLTECIGAYRSLTEAQKSHLNDLIDFHNEIRQLSFDFDNENNLDKVLLNSLKFP